MPAYTERVYICPEVYGQPIQIVSFPLWWNRRALFKRYGSRQIDTGNPVYVDYGLLLSATEAYAFDAECRASFAQDPHASGQLEAMKHWEALLSSARWIIVESYEWESGLE